MYGNYGFPQQPNFGYQQAPNNNAFNPMMQQPQGESMLDQVRRIFKPRNSINEADANYQAGPVIPQQAQPMPMQQPYMGQPQMMFPQQQPMQQMYPQQPQQFQPQQMMYPQQQQPMYGYQQPQPMQQPYMGQPQMMYPQQPQQMYSYQFDPRQLLQFDMGYQAPVNQPQPPVHPLVEREIMRARQQQQQPPQPVQVQAPASYQAATPGSYGVPTNISDFVSTGYGNNVIPAQPPQAHIERQYPLQQPMQQNVPPQLPPQAQVIPASNTPPIPQQGPEVAMPTNMMEVTYKDGSKDYLPFNNHLADPPSEEELDKIRAEMGLPPKSQKSPGNIRTYQGGWNPVTGTITPTISQVGFHPDENSPQNLAVMIKEIAKNNGKPIDEGPIPIDIMPQYVAPAIPDQQPPMNPAQIQAPAPQPQPQQAQQMPPDHNVDPALILQMIQNGQVGPKYTIEEAQRQRQAQMQAQQAPQQMQNPANLQNTVVYNPDGTKTYPYGINMLDEPGYVSNQYQQGYPPQQQPGYYQNVPNMPTYQGMTQRYDINAYLLDQLYRPDLTAMDANEMLRGVVLSDDELARVQKAEEMARWQNQEYAERTREQEYIAEMHRQQVGHMVHLAKIAHAYNNEPFNEEETWNHFESLTNDAIMRYNDPVNARERFISETYRMPVVFPDYLQSDDDDPKIAREREMYARAIAGMELVDLADRIEEADRANRSFLNQMYAKIKISHDATLGFAPGQRYGLKDYMDNGYKLGIEQAIRDSRHANRNGKAKYDNDQFTGQIKITSKQNSPMNINTDDDFVSSSENGIHSAYEAGRQAMKQATLDSEVGSLYNGYDGMNSMSCGHYVDDDDDIPEELKTAYVMFKDGTVKEIPTIRIRDYERDPNVKKILDYSATEQERHQFFFECMENEKKFNEGKQGTR